MSWRSTEALMWISGMIGYLTLLGILIGRRRAVAFSWFTALIAFEAMEAISLCIIHQVSNASLYAFVYWMLEIIETLIRVGVMIELARIGDSLLDEGWRSLIHSVYACLGLAACATTGIILFHHGPNDLLADFSIKTSVCTSIFGGFLAFGYGFSGFLTGLRLKLHSQAVAYGMFIYFSGKLLIEIFLLYGEVSSWHKLQDFLKPLYVLCLFAWSAVFWFDEPSRVLSLEMDRLHKATARLRQAGHIRTRTHHEKLRLHKLKGI